MVYDDMKLLLAQEGASEWEYVKEAMEEDAAIAHAEWEKNPLSALLLIFPLQGGVEEWELGSLKEAMEIVSFSSSYWSGWRVESPQGNYLGGEPIPF